MRKLTIPVLIVAIVVLLSSVFIVPEGERGIVTRFGRVLEDSNQKSRIYTPGLHFKIPMFDKVRTLDARIQTMDGEADRFVTSEKKDVIIDSYVKWRITDFRAYYLATGGDRLRAEALLERKVTDILRAEIGSHEIKQVVSRQLSKEEKEALEGALAKAKEEMMATQSLIVTKKEQEEEVDSLINAYRAEAERVAEHLKVDGRRDEIMKKVLEDTSKNAKDDLGIEIVDFRMKKINLPDEISESIYKRMRAEREAVARKHRSQGREKAEITRAEAELKVATLLAQADKAARVTRGEADAEAARIYAEAYSKDPEFFNFIRSLRAYEKSFAQKSDILVLDPNSDFFKYMKTATAEAE